MATATKKPRTKRRQNSPYLITVADWRRLLGTTEEQVERSIDTVLPDWRWPAPRKIRVEKRLGAQVPTEMRAAADALKRASGWSLSEIQRRALNKFLVEEAWR